VALFYALFVTHKLSPGEKGYILIITPTKKQGSIIKSYLSYYFNELPYFKPFLLRETAEEIELVNRVVIAVLSSDYRTIKGYTALMGITDETAFLMLEGPRSALEVIRALRSRLVSTGGPLLSISTPYSKRDYVYESYKRYFGVENGRILVWKATSLEANPKLDAELIKAELEEDPEGAKAEYGLDFRSDIETFIGREVVEAAVVPGRFEIPPMADTQYKGFVDPSGGHSDSMALGIAHREGDTLILDCLREVRPPFSPDQVVKDFSKVLKSYGLTSCVGDKYGGIWPQERFQTHGIVYKTSENTKSDIYRELLPLLNSGEVELLDHDKLVNQIANLERRVTRSGKDSIDHPPGGYDDLANVAGGALTLLTQRSGRLFPELRRWRDLKESSDVQEIDSQQ
jgi:hypothetical protein